MDLRMEVSPRPKGDKTSLKRSKWWTRLRSLINADAAVARYGANDRAGLLVDHLRAELAHPRRQAAIDDHEVVGARGGAIGRELFGRARRSGSIVSE